eukprot:scaffold279057_cov38-Attheya_sp.AAC.1
MAVSGVESGVVGVFVAHGWGRFVVGASPTLDLVDSVFHDGLLLVAAHEVPVISLVESPMLVHREIFLSHLHEHQVGSPDAATQQGRVHLVK